MFWPLLSWCKNPVLDWATNWKWKTFPQVLGSPRGLAFCTLFSYLWGNFQGVSYRGRVIASRNKRGDRTEVEAAAAERTSFWVCWLSFLESFPARFSPPTYQRSRQRRTTSEPTAWGASLSSCSFPIPTRSDLPYDLFMAIKLWNVHQSDCRIALFVTSDSGKETPAESRLGSS